MSRIQQVLIALDQLANAVLGGYADETISARSWRLQEQKPYCWLRPFIDTLFFWQIQHCREAFESENRRGHLPDEYRNAAHCQNDA